MIQKLLKETEGREWWINLIPNALVFTEPHAHNFKCEASQEANGTPNRETVHVIVKAAYDRVCAALVEAVRQRDHWIRCAIITQLVFNEIIERENETLAKILTGKTKEK